MLAQVLGKPREGHVRLEEAGPILNRIETNGLIVYRTQDARDTQMDMLVDSEWAGDVQNRSRRRSEQKINNGNGHHERITPLEAVGDASEQHWLQFGGFRKLRAGSWRMFCTLS